MSELRTKNTMAATMVLLSAASISMGSTAWSQEAGDGDDKLQEIIVTAQKREQNIQDVGVQVTALSHTALQMVNANDSTSLAIAVPSLQVTQYSPSLTVYNIRGVSQADFSDHQEGPIAFYNDEVYMSSLGSTSGQMFDVQRVEVLRGPQGTLFGRNATGGLIQVITNRPTDAYEGFATLSTGRYDQISTEAAVGGPITDTIKFRLSGATNKNDGFIKNGYPGGRDLGSSDNWGTRGQLQFDLTPGDKVLLKGEYLKNKHEISTTGGRPAGFDADGLGFLLTPDNNFYANLAAAAGANPAVYFSSRPGTNFCPGCTVFGDPMEQDFYRATTNYPGAFDRAFYSLSGRWDHDFDNGMTLTSLTNYQNLDKQYGQDVDASGNDFLHVFNDQTLNQVSQEFRLAGHNDRMNWVGGLYGLRISTDVHSTILVDPLVAELLAGFPLGSFASNNVVDYAQKTKSWAAFAQSDFKLTDLFTLVAGGRYSSDDKDYRFLTQAASFSGVTIYDFNNRFVSNASAFAPPGVPATLYDFSTLGPDRSSRKFNNWSGKVQLEARVDESSLLYIGVNRGTKGGGFNAPRTFPLPPNPFDPAAQTADQYRATLAAFNQLISFDQEVLTNYETGFKLTRGDGRYTLNGAYFYYDYDNYQAFTNNQANLLIVNLPAKMSGIELEATARAARGVSLGGFVTYMIKSDVKGAQLPEGRVADRKMPSVPEWSAGVSASWALGPVTLSTTWKYDSEQFFTTFNSAFDKEPSRTVGNVRVSYAPAENWELAAFVNNVTDKEYRVFASDNAEFISVGEDGPAHPRWWGASVSYRFGANR